jgi:hypothetical protein
VGGGTCVQKPFAARGLLTRRSVESLHEPGGVPSRWSRGSRRLRVDSVRLLLWARRHAGAGDAGPGRTPNTAPGNTPRRKERRPVGLLLRERWATTVVGVVTTPLAAATATATTTVAATEVVVGATSTPMAAGGVGPGALARIRTSRRLVAKGGRA